MSKKKKVTATLAVVVALVSALFMSITQPAQAAGPKPASATDGAVAGATLGAEGELVAEIKAPSVEEARQELDRLNAQSDEDPIFTMATVRKCTHFDVFTRDYPTCLDWVWDSINNNWRPGYHDVEKPTLACKIKRLDADFKIGSGSGTLIQRKGSPNGSFDYLQIGFNTTTLPGGGWFKDSQDPRVYTKVTTVDSTATTCNVVAHALIRN